MITLNDINYRVAFGVFGYLDGELKNDPRYVKWIIRHRGTKNGVNFEKILPYHKCDYNDFKEFYPLNPDSRELLEKRSK